MKIVIAGGSGFIGQPLVERLLVRGEVIVLSRNPSRVELGRGVAWNPPDPGPWEEEVASADVVINLAGENIAEGRWTAERKRRLRSSRVDATSALSRAISRNERRPLFISASAVGFYGPRGDEELDETAAAGEGFLSQLAADWERAATQAAGNARLVIPRIGLVLARDGGALKPLISIFKLGAGGPLGHGRQWMSWIERGDLVSFFEWAIDTPEAEGIYNLTSPTPVRNSEFVQELGRALHRPAILPTPGAILRIALGEMADALLLTGQRAVPRHLLSQEFKFRYPTLPEALAAVVGG